MRCDLQTRKLRYRSYWRNMISFALSEINKEQVYRD